MRFPLFLTMIRPTSIEINQRLHRLGFMLLLCFLLSPTLSLAQGDLMVYPKRIVFENSQRSQDLSLSNNGKDTARYLINVVQIRMKEDGNFENISVPDASQRFADKNFRFFPRNVVLAPGESQTVKIQLIRTGELSTGEYRSHIYLRAEAAQALLGEKDTTKKPANLSVKIVPVFGISVPVIIKVGESDAKVRIAELSFKTTPDNKPALAFKFSRSGNMSVYGDVTVNHISPAGKTTRVASVQGVAVYTPTANRSFQMRLDDARPALYRTGKLQVIYTEQAPKAAILAEAEISLK